MKIAVCILFAVTFIFFASDVFGWQISLYEEIKDFQIREENQVVLNLVFTHLRYTDTGEFKKDAIYLFGELKKIPPFFNEFKGFRVYFLELKPEEEKELFNREGGFPYIRIRNDLMDGLKEKLQTPYKLVLLDQETSLSAAELSDAGKISAIILGKKKHSNLGSFSRTFLHEIGHSLGLREENPSNKHGIIPGPPNCAPDKKSAVAWWGDMVGSVKGVGYVEFTIAKNKFIKPTHNSIMNNPYSSSDYGPVNERYLRNELGLENMKQ